MNGNIQFLLTKVFSRPGWKWFILSTVLVGVTGVIGMIAFSELSSASFIPPETIKSLPADSGQCLTGQGQSVLEAKKLAMAYYVKKYNDSEVDINVVPHEDYMEADVRKNDELVKRLSIKGGTIIEYRCASSDWALDLLCMIN